MSRNSATIEDFRAWLDFHLDETVKKATVALNKMRAEMSTRGMLHSGAAGDREFEIVEEGLRQGIDLALGECKRAGRVTSIDDTTLRQITEERLSAFLAKVKAPALPKAGSRTQVVAKIEWLSKLDGRLAFALRQFDVGLFDPAEPEGPLTMTNSINIGVMSGGMLQQATAHSTQSATNSFNSGAAKEALDAFADALKGASLRQEQLIEIQAELDTIRAQLAKSSPSTSIIQEAGRSIRSIVEGVVAGALTSPVMERAQNLFRALGLG